MGILIMVGQVLLSLSILIILHEWGHFYAARTFNTRVEKFYLFFNPWFSLFKKQIGETEYGLGWLPLGGYVKISGMIDESFDKEQMEGPPQEWEFRSKPAWQRLIIMLGGVIVNFILGFFIYSMILWYYGESYFPAKNITEGIHIMDPIAEEMGLENGDKILRIGETEFDRFESGAVVRELVLNNATTIDLIRDFEEIQIEVPTEVIPKLSSYGRGTLFRPRTITQILKIHKGGNAEKAGLLADDHILNINGKDVSFYDLYLEEIKNLKSQEGNFLVDRGGVKKNLLVQINENGIIGFTAKLENDLYESAAIKYNILAAIPAGIKKGINFLATQIKAFGQMGKGKIKVKESVGGPIAIAEMFGREWVWSRFWTLTAVLSLILGFMNLLPIPALDGGHVMFLMWEIITGKKPSDKVLEYATMAGFIILMALMILIFGNDIRRLITGMLPWI